MIGSPVLTLWNAGEHNALVVQAFVDVHRRQPKGIADGLLR
jgi:hypothetical protein